MRGISLSMALLAAGSAVEAAQPACAKGLYMVVARGSLEDPGPGTTQVITDKIQELIPDSVVAPIDYPATLDNYGESETKGVQAMHKVLGDYKQACPDSKMAIFGYSQGAHISMDTICGGIGDPYDADPPVSAATLDNVVAVALYGDPTHVANLTYDRGTSVRNGIFIRNNTAPCLKFADKLISYCDFDDIYCDGGKNMTVHHLYITKYGDEITKYVVDKFNAGSNNNKTSGGAPPSGANATFTTTSPTPSNTLSSAGQPKPTTEKNAAAAVMAPANSLFFGAAVLAVLTTTLSQIML
ncbi:Acetylxylan esterase 2-like protein [Cladobotryum mycophilum]|uniref:Acetylxylan esterase 2-like protein n=1 Tax=Cladobotryum mycophilum TaxID=491253 RepID=A0ABR0SWY8_9HYPO